MRKEDKVMIATGDTGRKSRYMGNLDRNDSIQNLMRKDQFSSCTYKMNVHLNRICQQNIPECKLFRLYKTVDYNLYECKALDDIRKIFHVRL